MREDDLPTSILLRDARDAYTHAIRGALREHGVEELPRNSVFLLAGLSRGDPLAALVAGRERSIERSGAVEALRAAGCLEAVGDGARLTTKGRDVADGCARARRTVDGVVARAIGDDGLRTLRAGLLVLAEWHAAEAGAHRHGD